MLNRDITNGTKFVVFDMEWNQPFPGKDYSFDVSELTGEIIEIGAVKLIYKDGKLVEDGVFSSDIKPQRYTKLHYHVKKVTHKTDAELKNGISFVKAYQKFVSFCGDDAILVGWGNSDPDMLKMNLKFFNIDNNLNRYFLDVQPVFSLFSGEPGKQKSVEFAVDYYEIPKTSMFHSATADASYTADIFKAILANNDASEVLSVIKNSSYNPDIKREYSVVGGESASQSEALNCIKGFTDKCPICEKALKLTIEEFRIRKVTYSTGNCEQHGTFFVRQRIKKSKNGKFYASAIVRFATQNDLFLIKSKSEEYMKYGTSGAPLPPKVDKNVENLT